MIAYSLLRPVGIGTYPADSDIVSVHNFDNKRFVEEIGRTAYGYVEYAGDVTEARLNAYDMLSPTYMAERGDLMRIAEELAGYKKRGEEDEFQARAREAMTLYDGAELCQAIERFL